MDNKEFERREVERAKEERAVLEAQEARKSEARKGEPKVVFTKVAGSEEAYLPEEAPAAKDAKAFREFQLGIKDNTPENAVAVGLPHPESQTINESQLTDKASTELVFTKDTKDLPKGAAGAIIADGVFEINKGTVGAEPDAKSNPVDPKAKAEVKPFGSHPVRLEDDTHTNQS